VAGGTSSISPWAILHVGQRLQLSINHQLAHEAFPHARTALACDSYRYSIPIRVAQQNQTNRMPNNIFSF
jgi:hypothetical protein